MKGPLHPRVARYLRDFDAAASVLPLPRRRVLRQEIRAHLIELIPVGAADDQAEKCILDFGTPAAIVEQESPVPPAAPRKLRRPRASRLVVLVGCGALILGAAIVVPIFVQRAAIPESIVNAHPRGVARVTSGDAYFDYLDAIKTIRQPLPPGAVYPAGVPAGLNSGKHGSGVLEFGGGSDAAHFTWLCAWEAEYLADVKDKDVERRVAAERMLEWWGNSAWWRVADPTHGWDANVVAPMKFGSPTGVQDDLGDACSNAGIAP